MKTSEALILLYEYEYDDESMNIWKIWFGFINVLLSSSECSILSTRFSLFLLLHVPCHVLHKKTRSMSFSSCHFFFNYNNMYVNFLHKNIFLLFQK